MSLEKVIFHIDVNSAFLSWEAVLSAASFGMERRFKRTGVSGRWGYGDASWNHFGKIHSSKEISDTDR